MTGNRPPLSQSMLDQIEQVVLELTGTSETIYYLERQSVSVIDTLCYQQNNCLFIARNSLATIENAEAHHFEELSSDLDLVQSFIHNVGKAKYSNNVRFSQIGKQLQERVDAIKSNNNRQLNKLNNHGLTELIHLCPTVRFGKHYIRKAYPKVQQLTSIIDRCFYQTYQLIPEQFLESINNFQLQLSKLLKSNSSRCLNDALVQACLPLPDYSLQFARLKILSFLKAYLLLNEQEVSMLTYIEEQPLNTTSIERAIDLVNKKYDELITKTHSISGETA